MWKDYLIIGLSVIAILDVLIILACCKVSSKANRRAEMIYHNYMQSVNNKNNIDNEGE